MRTHDPDHQGIKGLDHCTRSRRFPASHSIQQCCGPEAFISHIITWYEFMDATRKPSAVSGKRWVFPLNRRGARPQEFLLNSSHSRDCHWIVRGVPLDRNGFRGEDPSPVNYGFDVRASSR